MTQEEFVRRIRACGQAIVDHAEDIVNNYRYLTDLTVSFNMDLDASYFPRIEVTSTFLPEGVVDKRFIGYDPTDNLQMELLGELLGIDFFIFSILGNN